MSDELKMNGEEKNVEQTQASTNGISDEAKNGYMLLAEGNRSMLIKDYETAVENLSQSCEILSRIFGELGPECAEAFFSYGSACIELAKEENQLMDIGESEKKSAENEDGDEDMEVANEEQDSDDEDDENDKDETTKEDNEENCETTKEDTEENCETFQIAWESLECAKKIYQNQNNFQKLVDTHIKLAEISIYTANYSVAIEDLKTALDLCKSHNFSGRRLASILFQLGLAYQSEHKYSDAITVFQESIGVLKNCVQDLATEGSTEEVQKLNTFIAAIEEHIVDAKSTDRVFQLQLNKNQAGCSRSLPSNAPVDDISHLVRSKGSAKAKENAQKDKQIVEDEKMEG